MASPPAQCARTQLCRCQAARRLPTPAPAPADGPSVVVAAPGEGDQETTPLAPSDPIAPLRAALAGRYEIGREIGQGAFATVCLANDSRHDREVALKVLNVEHGSESGEVRLVREIRMLAR